jgi:hypothetical protein
MEVRAEEERVREAHAKTLRRKEKPEKKFDRKDHKDHIDQNWVVSVIPSVSEESLCVPAQRDASLRSA